MLMLTLCPAPQGQRDKQPAGPQTQRGALVKSSFAPLAGLRFGGTWGLGSALHSSSGTQPSQKPAKSQMNLLPDSSS